LHLDLQVDLTEISQIGLHLQMDLAEPLTKNLVKRVLNLQADLTEPLTEISQLGFAFRFAHSFEID